MHSLIEEFNLVYLEDPFGLTRYEGTDFFPNLHEGGGWLYFTAAPVRDTRGTVIGFFLGLIPGIGAVIPTFAAYVVEKKVSKHPEKFGTGVIQGVAGPESANNAATGGAFIPSLHPGHPGQFGHRHPPVRLAGGGELLLDAEVPLRTSGNGYGAR
jgi:hypothetical protein